MTSYLQSTPSGPLRLCPDCGTRMDFAICPTDGHATVTAHPLDPYALIKKGDLLGERYRVMRQIGRGGYGAVYAAEHVGTGQKVAIKVLKNDFEGPDDSSVRRFFREARVTAALSHPNTVRLFDVGQTPGGQFFLAMELLRGPSLEAVLQARTDRKEVLSEPQAIDLGMAILRSLQEAHTQHLVHRDLKPANILLADFGDDEPVVKVLDFGIAFVHGSSLTTSGMALGTPAYMSPEQCQGIEIDGRSDLYSLAVVLYRCVSGKVPFHMVNPVAVMQAHVMEQVPDVRLVATTPVSAEFAGVLSRALAKKPGDRWDRALDMRKALELVRTQHWADTPSTLRALVASTPQQTGMHETLEVSQKLQRAAGHDTAEMAMPPLMDLPTLGELNAQARAEFKRPITKRTPVPDRRRVTRRNQQVSREAAAALVPPLPERPTVPVQVVTSDSAKTQRLQATPHSGSRPTDRQKPPPEPSPPVGTKATTTPTGMPHGKEQP